MVGKTLKDSVKEHDIEGIRAIFFSILSRRPNSSKITENLNYCFNNGIKKDELFVAHDGEEFPQNPNEWSLEYYHKQVGKIENNFSKERIAQLLKMADYLFKKETQSKDSKQKNATSKDMKNGLIYVAVGAVAALIAFLLF